jgi:DNA-binding NarL/FixJ family response regulator
MTPLRVLLVGSPPDRARLRAKLGSAAVEIVAEFSTLAAARSADLDFDAITIAGDGPTAASPIDDVGRRGRSWPEDDEPQEALTPREVQVLELLAEGLPNKAIAARLNISDQTVKFHVSAICGKLGAANRTDAVRRAVRRGLITL